MKRFLSIAVVVLMIAAVFSACGRPNVTTTVDAKYVDDFAKGYASDIKTDDDGNTTYEFTADQYDKYMNDYRSAVKDEYVKDIKTPGQYSYISEDAQSLIIGVDPDSYDEETCRAEAEQAGKAAMKVNMNSKNPSGKIAVTVENANTAEDYFTIEVTAD